VFLHLHWPIRVNGVSLAHRDNVTILRLNVVTFHYLFRGGSKSEVDGAHCTHCTEGMCKQNNDLKT